MVLIPLKPTLATLLLASSALALKPRDSNIVPGKYIVTLSSQSNSRERAVADPEAILAPLLRRVAPSARIGQTYKTAGIFSGAVVQLSAPADLTQLLDSADVLSVTPVRRYPAPKGVGAPQLVSSADPGDTFSPHIMMGVDKLHNEGYRGAGMKVAVLDTGIDYRHPAFGNCYATAGCKIAGGRDLVGDLYDGNTVLTTTPDADPFSDARCGPHGTHVAGTVAADSKAPSLVFTGVVPDAKLYIYRLFGCEALSPTKVSYTDDSVIIDGLLQAFNDGADVITLSLGGSSGWSESPANVVASNLVAAGRVVTIAQGNEGSTGTFYGSSPAGGINTWAIGSVDNTKLVGYNATLTNGSPSTFSYYAAFPPGFNNLPLYALNTDSSTANTGDACSALPASTPDLSKFLVLVKRGTCLFTDKYTNLAAKGAKNVIIYNNAASITYAPDGSDKGLEHIVVVDNPTGIALVKAAASGATPSTTGAMVTATDSTIVPIDAPTGGRMSSYSSYGPNFLLDTPSPFVSAPGGNILSTWPLDEGGFSIISGTSMATPAVAGAAALYMSIKGKDLNPIQLRDLFSATASPIGDYGGGDLLESVIHQGGGLINVYNAVKGPLRPTPGFFLLNDTTNFRSTQTVTIKNTGSTTLRYTPKHVPAGTAITFEEGSKVLHNAWPVPLVSNAAKATFDKRSVSIAPGASQTLTVTFTAPSGLDASSAPLYSGYIQVGPLSIPYYGLAAPLNGIQILDDTSDILGIKLPSLLDSSDNTVTAPATVSLSNPKSAVNVIWRLATGSRYFSVDVVKSTATLQPTYSKRDVMGKADMRLVKRARAPRPPRNMFGSIGLLQSGEYAYRNAEDVDTDYYLAAFNGTVTSPTDPTVSSNLPTGQKYKLLLRALKLTGNPLNEADYETWLSPELTLTA